MEATDVTESALKADSQNRQGANYASFGEDGVTATANAYGNLLQMTRYFGADSAEPSGFFCAELYRDAAPSPFRAPERLRRLNLEFTRPKSGSHLRVGIANQIPTKVQPVSFIGNRWPKFVHETPRPMEVRFVVHEQTVYQLYSIPLHDDKENDQKNSKHPRLFLRMTMRIRGLNFTKDDDGFESSLSAGGSSSNTELTSQDDHLSEDEIFTEASSHEDSSSEDSTYNDLFKSEDSKIDGAMMEASKKGSNYVVAYWPGRKPKQMQEGTNVCLYVAAFVGDDPQPTTLRGRWLEIILDKKNWAQAGKAGRLEVTVAYRLDLLGSDPFPDLSPVSKENLASAKRKLAYSSTTPLLSADPKLNYRLWRNLEHILSVCSIPVAQHFAANTSHGAARNIYPIALTCGDIASHRIVTKASFHTFRFLHWAKLHIDKLVHDKLWQDEDETCSDDYKIRVRISNAYEGHVMWLSVNWATQSGGNENPSNELPAPRCWASGRARTRVGGDPWLLHDLRIDTALQITKVATFLSRRGKQATSQSSEEPKSLWMRGLDKVSLVRSFETIVTSWLKGLDKGKRVDKHVYPRSRKGKPDMFFFADHAVIWWAVKSIEELGMSPNLEFYNVEKLQTRSKQLNASEAIQLSFVKRFTTENPVTRKRMLATSRSQMSTQVLLSTEETMLVYAAEQGLLSKASKQEKGEKITLWASTLDCQKYHEEENDDNEWNHTAQFALALMLASQNYQINSRAPPEMYTTARSVLMESSWSNGLFAGMLDSQQPVFFEEKDPQDSYWSATFEIPYILGQYAQSSNMSTGAVDTRDLSAQPPHPPELSWQNPDAAKMSEQVSQVVSLLNRSVPRIMLTTVNKAPAMRQHIPFGGGIDGRNTVELFDDWLYSVPKFFSFRGQLDGKTLQSWCLKMRNFFGMAVIGKGIGTINRLEIGEEYDGKNDKIKAIIVDVPGTNSSTQSDGSGGLDTPISDCIQSNGELLHRLGKERTWANAKKRLLQFFHVEQTTALICYLVSSKEEGLVHFFDRHNGYEKLMFDDVSRLANTWVTEMHLSFYRVLDQESSKDNLQAEFPTNDEILFPSSKKKADKWIRRAIISFRFDGDFFDRFWTCHFMEHDPGNDLDKLQELDVKGFDPDGKHWQQRRVLELILFDRILERMTAAIYEILDEARTRVLLSLDNDRKNSGTSADGPRKSALAEALTLLEAKNNDDFLEASVLCHKIQHLLQAMMDDLDKNLTVIQQWSGQEGQRIHDKPRWTRKDEHRHRGEISKWQASNKYKIQELRRQRADIASYNSSLARKLEDIRNDLTLRGADDIRLFTYITAFFLPVGFATGFFSMNGPPSGNTVGGMLGFAVVALLITLVAIVNAQTLRRKIMSPAINGSATALRILQIRLSGPDPKGGETQHPGSSAASSFPSNVNMNPDDGLSRRSRLAFFQRQIVPMDR